MPTAKSKPLATTDHRVVDQRTLPMDALFEQWEMADWPAINKAVSSGKAVHVENVSGHDERHWIGCALRELGRHNVFVSFCHLTLDDRPSFGLWIIPRGALQHVLLEGYERVHG